MAIIMAVAAAALPVRAVIRWLAYRDYLRSHRTFMESVREMREEAPMTAAAIEALAPVPPLHLPRGSQGAR